MPEQLKSISNYLSSAIGVVTKSDLSGLFLPESERGSGKDLAPGVFSSLMSDLKVLTTKMNAIKAIPDTKQLEALAEFVATVREQLKDQPSLAERIADAKRIDYLRGMQSVSPGETEEGVSQRTVSADQVEIVARDRISEISRQCREEMSAMKEKFEATETALAVLKAAQEVDGDEDPAPYGKRRRAKNNRTPR
eukprot:gb/GEZN01008704.1/.p1 GENE.gb/GEZN01008704.1/~~gb/GEZN01008704.1/.p1  ORF type:complete len:194 (-),score=31.11 gb/GEZN01008704.1/:328-909(-)